MKVFDFPFPIEIGSVCDLDFAQDGTVLSIQGSESQQVVIWGEKRHMLPQAWSSPEYPFIRYLHDGRILLVDTSFRAARGKNAWIMDSRGVVQVHFELGSAAVEISSLWGLIAVAFHPLSAKANGHQVQPIQRTGVAFFDTSGRLLMGFNQEAARYGMAVENVRCMAPISRSQLLFVPERLTVKGVEVENPVVLFDCASRRPIAYSAPFPGAEAISMAAGEIHLASPEDWEDQIITFDAESKISQHRGEFLGIFRGLEGGAFLAQLSSADYAVVTPGPIDSSLKHPELEIPTQV